MTDIKNKIKQLLKQAYIDPTQMTPKPIFQGIDTGVGEFLEGGGDVAGAIPDAVSNMPQIGQQAMDFAGENPWSTAAMTGIPLGLGAVGLKRALGRRLAGGAGASQAAEQATQTPGMMSGLKDMYSQGMEGLGKLHPNAPTVAKGLGALGLGYMGYKGLQGLSGGDQDNKRHITVS